MANDKFLIRGLGGKKKLKGTIAVSGAKNAALKAMASSILFKDTLTAQNVPNIEDVKRMSDLLGELGCNVKKKNSHTYIFTCGNNLKTDLSSEISKRMRSSIVLSGPLLARFGEVSFPHPGGCVIGERPIDFFIDGFRRMGAVVNMKGGDKKVYVIRAPKKGLRGATIFLKSPSVTATETLMMAGILAKGTTVIQNAALEPEIKDVADFLAQCGANIKGVGTTTITVKGGELLSARGKTYTTMPDRIEAGSFIILGALGARTLRIENCNPNHLTSLIDTLRTAGVPLKVGNKSITVSSSTKRESQFTMVSIKTHEYPGFPTDLQAPMMVLLTQATGEAIVFETIFEGRLNYTESLVSMGADITPMDPHRVLVKGPALLRGKKLESPDLRAGLAFIIAATIAKGNSTIHSVYNIDRGYEHIEDRLKAIGVDIKRVSD